MDINFIKKRFEKNIDKLDIFDQKLPTISFALFKAKRLKNTELVWVNTDLLKVYGYNGTIEEIENFLLEQYSYVSDGYTNKSRVLDNERKAFWADRYGSRHEVCNGGSARCGFDGYFQVKGIGLTPLLAQNMSESHSHGKLFLDEAIAEAIWGELCHKHLPLGSIRTLAIIKTNVHQEFLYLDDKPKKPCALAIREFAIRPAHFERAAFFWPSDENMFLRCDDANRVRESIKYLPISLGLSDTKLSSKQELFNCLKVLVCRIAKQVAYSRVKGIPHGSLTSSNIGIDGRFLDFGTITAVPDFGNYVLADGVGAVWDDHLLITDWLKNLLITLNKYSMFNEDFSEHNVQNLIELFLLDLGHYENYAILEELDVKDKNSNNLHLAQKIKNSLVSSNRMHLGEFRSDAFKYKIIELAKQENLIVGDFNFELRNFKYSSFSILNDDNLIKCRYSRDSINNLISQYC
ncbi:protein adenylyltransferase SelO family protein [Photobacterium minamisatsumaniensis]|uniref:protein adenylyltransferase SelO family protein n=1 Tax=Photobacterium minamisatsumaniensis TaxID=2910233 RepID=UPI003D0A23C9